VLHCCGTTKTKHALQRTGCCKHTLTSAGLGREAPVFLILLRNAHGVPATLQICTSRANCGVEWYGIMHARSSSTLYWCTLHAITTVITVQTWEGRTCRVGAWALCEMFQLDGSESDSLQACSTVNSIPVSSRQDRVRSHMSCQQRRQLLGKRPRMRHTQKNRLHQAIWLCTCQQGL
jgi:hypothetical protein